MTGRSMYAKQKDDEGGCGRGGGVYRSSDSSAYVPKLGFPRVLS